VINASIFLLLHSPCKWNKDAIFKTTQKYELARIAVIPSILEDCVIYHDKVIMSDRIQQAHNIAIIGEAPTTGDEAIAIGLCKALLKEFPDAKFTVFTSRPKLYRTIKNQCDSTVTEVSGPGSSYQSKWSRYAFAISLLTGITKLWRNHPFSQKALQISQSHRLIFLQGGPAWAESLVGSPRALLGKLLFLSALKRDNCQVFSLGQSVGMIPAMTVTKKILCRLLLKRALSTLSAMAPRDQESLVLIEDLIPRAASQGVDTALGIKQCVKPSNPDKLEALTRRRVGLCVRDFQSYYGHEQHRDRYITEFAQLIDRLHFLEFEIVWIATDYREDSGKLSDLDMISLIVRRCSIYEASHNLPLHNGALDPHEILAVSETLDLVISTRLHPIILSSLNCVPSISISYDKKCRRFMESIGMDTFCMNLATFNAKETESNLLKLIEKHQQFRISIYEAIRDQQNLLQKQISLIAEQIRENNSLSNESLSSYRS